MERLSSQGKIILEELEKRKDHPTAEKIHIDLKNRMPNIGIATVYRNLAKLNKMGKIRKVDAQDGFDHFDANLKPHMHFMCQKCGKILDIELKEDKKNEIEKSIPNIEKQIKAKITSTNITMLGICDKCRKIK